MECMKGVKWNTMVQRENTLFKKKVESVCSKEDLLNKANEFENAKKKIFFIYENIIIQNYGSYEYEWFYTNNTSIRYFATDIFIYKKYTYHIRDIGNGSQKYRLECLDIDKVLWHVDNVGPQVYVINDICYYLTAKNKLWYNSVVGVDYKSGNNLIIIYEENDKRFNLSLVKGDNDCLFLLRENSGKQNLFVIEGVEIIYENLNLQNYYPIGYYKEKICYLENSKNIWNGVGFTLHKQFNKEIEYFSIKNNIVILRDYGLKRIYNLHFKEYTNFYGNIILNKFI